MREPPPCLGKGVDFIPPTLYTILIVLSKHKGNINKKPRTNNQITAPEVRVVGADGSNVGVLPTSEALAMAKEQGLSLIEVSAKAQPPVARIMDYGKYQYQKEKEARAAKKKAKEVEIKGVRARVNISPHDLDMKVRKIEEFLGKGDRVRFELMLRGREKGIKKDFIEERLNTMFASISIPYEIADGPKKSPRGRVVILAPGKNENKQSSQKTHQSDEDGKNTTPPTETKSL